SSAGSRARERGKNHCREGTTTELVSVRAASVIRIRVCLQAYRKCTTYRCAFRRCRNKRGGKDYGSENRTRWMGSYFPDWRSPGWLQLEPIWDRRFQQVYGRRQKERLQPRRNVGCQQTPGAAGIFVEQRSRGPCTRQRLGRMRRRPGC